MREYLNSNTLFATIAMYSSESDDLVLVVEGDDDQLVLKDHCSAELRIIAGIGGKMKVLETANLVRQQQLRRVRFLLDRDYDSYSCEEPDQPENVFFSETHDFFMDLLAKDERLLSKLIDVHMARVFRRPDDRSSTLNLKVVEEEVKSLASIVAAVRVVDAKAKLGLSFNKFSFGELRREDINPQVITQKILTRSKQPVESINEIQFQVDQLCQKTEDLAKIPISDHDLFKALSRVLKFYDVSVSDRELQRGFLLAISCRSIALTTWYREIQEWSRQQQSVGLTCSSSLGLAA